MKKNCCFEKFILLYFSFLHSYLPHQKPQSSEDLDWKGECPSKIVSSTLVPNKKEVFPLSSPTIAVHFYLNKRGKIKIAPQNSPFLRLGSILKQMGSHPNQSLPKDKKKPKPAKLRLESPYFNIKQRKTYEVQFNLTAATETPSPLSTATAKAQYLHIARRHPKMKKKNLFGKERLILSILEEGTTIQEEQFITKGHFWMLSAMN